MQIASEVTECRGGRISSGSTAVSTIATHPHMRLRRLCLTQTNPGDPISWIGYLSQKSQHKTKRHRTIPSRETYDVDLKYRSQVTKQIQNSRPSSTQCPHDNPYLDQDALEKR